MSGDLNKITGKQIAMITEAADGQGSIDIFSTLLNACWVSTTDPGPYPFVQEGDAKPPWKRLLKGDLLAGTVALRRYSLKDGDEFEFDHRCPECGSKVPWRVSLDEIVRTKTRFLRPEAIERVRAGVDFEQTYEGRKVLYRGQTLEQEEKIRDLLKRLKRKRATVVETLWGQITHIDGCKDQLQRWNWLAALDMGQLGELRDLFDADDCGLDTAIEIKCVNSDCGWEFEISLPLAGKSFFAQRKKRPKTEMDLEEAFRDFSDTSSEASAPSGGASASTFSAGSSTAVPATG